MYRIESMPSKVGTFRDELVWIVQKRVKILWFYIWITMVHGSGQKYWTDKKWADDFLKDLEKGLQRNGYGWSLFRPSQVGSDFGEGGL